MNNFDHELIFKYELKQLMIKHNISFKKAMEIINELKHQDRPWMSANNPNDYLSNSIPDQEELSFNH